MRNMDIGVDANEILHGERAIRRYAFNLIRELSDIESPYRYRLLYFRFRKPYHKPLEWTSEQKRRISEKTVFFPGQILEKIWQAKGWPNATSLLGNIGLFHAPGTTVVPKGKAPMVITVHGMHHVTIPTLIDPDYCCWYEGFMKWCLSQGDYFITVSETMRQDFLKTYDVKPEKVKKISLGVSPEFKPRDAEAVKKTLQDRFGIHRPYLLYVGGIQKHKNVECVIQAFSKIRKKGHKDLLLVLAGDQPKGAEAILSMIPRLGLESYVKAVGYLNQEKEDLAFLYCGARAFLFPSFYEGWASPPLESMASNVPVVAADVPALRENLGQAAFFCDPHDPDAFAEKIDLLLSDAKTYRDYQERGIKQVQPMTWKRMAVETVEFYKSCLSS